jgi:hypothetical protein
MEVDMDTVKLAKTPREVEFDYSVPSLPQRMHSKLNTEFAKRVAQPVTPSTLNPESGQTFHAPRWFSAHREHHKAFYEAVRTRKPHFEDAVFGFRAAGPSLLTNTSLSEGRVCKWDAEAMTAA